MKNKITKNYNYAELIIRKLEKKQIKIYTSEYGHITSSYQQTNCIMYTLYTFLRNCVKGHE